jgi:hypothetical protein
MVAVTYAVSRVVAPGKARAAGASQDRSAPKKSWLSRLFDAIAEARMQQARREIARHAHLLPYSLDERGNRLVKSSKDEMPFGGW